VYNKVKQCHAGQEAQLWTPVPQNVSEARSVKVVQKFTIFLSDALSDVMMELNLNRMLSTSCEIRDKKNWEHLITNPRPDPMLFGFPNVVLIIIIFSFNFTFQINFFKYAIFWLKICFSSVFLWSWVKSMDSVSPTKNNVLQPLEPVAGWVLELKLALYIS